MVDARGAARLEAVDVGPKPDEVLALGADVVDVELAHILHLGVEGDDRDVLSPPETGEAAGDAGVQPGEVVDGALEAGDPVTLHRTAEVEDVGCARARPCAD